MTKRIEAREEDGYRATWTIGGPGADGVDLTGWTFSAVFQRQAGSPDFTLGMAGAADPADEGFFVVSGINRQISVCILAATLQGITDTTGHFEIYADLYGTPSGGVAQFIKPITLVVTSAAG